MSQLTSIQRPLFLVPNMVAQCMQVHCPLQIARLCWLGTVSKFISLFILDRQAIQKLDAKVRTERTSCGEKVQVLLSSGLKHQGNIIYGHFGFRDVAFNLKIMSDRNWGREGGGEGGEGEKRGEGEEGEGEFSYSLFTAFNRIFFG